jgi:hyaluronoglucosaminidase
MKPPNTFHRRGIVEGFFGPPWSMAHRRRLFALGAARGMNTYLYAPKDDPYHRKLWRRPYSETEWRELLRLIRAAQTQRIDFVYGFHPGEGLYFGDDRAVAMLLRKAQGFVDAGVRTFAVLFDDIPSRLSDPRDRRAYKNSLARAEGTWMAKIIAAQPATWNDIEWWICPSYYSEDALLERVFGRFESEFLETLSEYLPPNVPCFWTGPSVVSKSITVAHVRRIAKKIQRPLLLWDNYPVNDLSMRDELHLGPLIGRNPRLPEIVCGYLNNPLLQEDLSFIPLATCFDYARTPSRYQPEASWTSIVRQRFGAEALPHWRALRSYAEASIAAKKTKRPPRLSRSEKRRLRAACTYVEEHRGQRWVKELEPWHRAISKLIADL